MSERQEVSMTVEFFITGNPDTGRESHFDYPHERAALSPAQFEALTPTGGAHTEVQTYDDPFV